jgi:hypothetical protein
MILTRELVGIQVTVFQVSSVGSGQNAVVFCSMNVYSAVPGRVTNHLQCSLTQPKVRLKQLHCKMIAIL